MRRKRNNNTILLSVAAVGFMVFVIAVYGMIRGESMRSGRDNVVGSELVVADEGIRKEPERKSPKRTLTEKKEVKEANVSHRPEVVERQAPDYTRNLSLKGIYIGMKREDALKRLRELVHDDLYLVNSNSNRGMSSKDFYFWYIMHPKYQKRQSTGSAIDIDARTDTVVGIGFSEALFEKVFDYRGDIKDFAQQFMSAYSIPKFEVDVNEPGLMVWKHVKYHSGTPYEFLVGHRPGMNNHNFVAITKLKKLVSDGRISVSVMSVCGGVCQFCQSYWQHC